MRLNSPFCRAFGHQHSGDKDERLVADVNEVGHKVIANVHMVSMREVGASASSRPKMGKANAGVHTSRATYSRLEVMAAKGSRRS